MKQKKLLSVLLAGAMVVSGGSISGLEGIIPEVVAAASSTEWNGQPGVFQVNREAARSTFYSFDTAEKAKAKDRTKSSFYQLLNGDDWKFSWAVKPADRIGAKDANFNQKDYDDSSWDNITVPKSWQTYVNKDGSWKYDPVIYSNQNYPWMNAEGKAYNKYKVGDAPTELRGVIFKDPMAPDAVEVGWQTADDYLSGDVRSKLRVAQMAADRDSSFHINVEALQKAQPKDLDASEIDVRLGATWIDADYIQQFMEETFETPYYLRRSIEVKFSELTAEWRINGKSSPNYNDVAAYVTYGTERANAYRILEETLNLKDIRIYDTIEDADGKQKRVLNKKETTLAQQKQQAIKCRPPS